MKFLAIVPLLFVFLTSCWKEDKIDYAGLHNNPFDPGYYGSSVFHFDTTYDRITVIPGVGDFHTQAFEFTANSSLFLHPTEYQVHIKDLVSNDVFVLDPIDPGGDRFRYDRLVFLHGQELCLEVALSNSGSYARPETICGTLP